MKASETKLDTFDVISSGFESLDEVLGVGGFPSRKIVEISGAWSVGKSTLALQVVAQAQKQGRDCLFADAEFSFSREYANALGVDCDKLDLEQAPYAEALLDAIETWAGSHKDGLIVLDAVGSLLPKEEAEKGSEARSIGLQARLMGSFTRRVIPVITMRNHSFVILNHSFIDIQTSRLKTSGGEKLAYAKAIWITLKRTFGKAPKRSGDGLKTVLFIEAEVRKNKISPTEGKKAQLEMIPGLGFSNQKTATKKRTPKSPINK